MHYTLWLLRLLPAARLLLPFLLLAVYSANLASLRVDTSIGGALSVSTRILGRRTAPVPPFLVPHRAPHGFTPRS